MKIPMILPQNRTAPKIDLVSISTLHFYAFTVKY
jgi:hypothetical protein